MRSRPATSISNSRCLTADEIGDLAESFNQMTKGLRERADMQKFVSQSTLEMIQSPRRWSSAGERKILTIFFSDIRGFTSLSESRDPEQVVKILNRIFTIQAEQVKRFSGDIDKYVGDEIVALFQGEGAALNAIRCAAAIHNAMETYNAVLSPEEPQDRAWNRDHDWRSYSRKHRKRGPTRLYGDRLPRESLLAPLFSGPPRRNATGGINLSKKLAVYCRRPSSATTCERLR